MENLKFTKNHNIVPYLILMFVLLVGACNPRKDEGEDVHKTNQEECDVIKQKLTYIKDKETGLCFAILNNYTDGFRSTFAITCVPCDSLIRNTIR